MEQISLHRPADDRRMTRKAELSFAELIERGVPLSAAEAVALTLAAWDSGAALPGDSAILLSSTGQVTCAADRPPREDDPARVAGLLHRLLRLDEADAGDRRGRVPGGLLVALARTMRQIDLPPLSSDAFHDALTRFTSPDPALLAGVFWRAARMRPRRGDRLTAGRTAGRTRTERRAHGPTTADLRRWLRQSECELFKLRQSRAGSAGMAAAVALIMVAILGIGAAIRERTPAVATSGGFGGGAPDLTRSGLVAPDVAAVEPLRGGAPALSTTASESSSPPARKRPAAARARPAQASVTPPVRTAASPAPRTRRRTTVDMVNLPRAPWAVVRRLDSAAPR
jgi:hypothetical protein